MRRKKSSKYKYVCFSKVGTSRQTDRWTAQMMLPNGKQWTKKCKTERGAAIAADTKLIELGRKPVNILKRK